MHTNAKPKPKTPSARPGPKKRPSPAEALRAAAASAPAKPPETNVHCPTSEDSHWQCGCGERNWPDEAATELNGGISRRRLDKLPVRAVRGKHLDAPEFVNFSKADPELVSFT